MKARIVDRSHNVKMVLSYGITGGSLTSLLEVAKELTIVVRQVMPSELDVKVSQLMKVAQLNLEDYPKGCERCILMVGFDSTSMDTFLERLKCVNVDVPLKAIVTPTNQTWNFNQLLAELTKEHGSFSKSPRRD